ncbi:LOW QUALITY PROTEIN: coiled-coil domain-containing protein 89 [Cariama cristata]
MAQDEREAGMANSTSDPETGKEMEDLTKGLEELCESPEEEKSEKALLHSRLEEQYHLICTLNKKADNARKRCRGLEQLNTELEKLRMEDAVRRLLQRLEALQEKRAYESRRAQEREKALLEAQSQQVSAYAREVDSLKNQLQYLEAKHQQTVAEVEHAESQQRAQSSKQQAKLERAKEEKEQVPNLAMERGKALRDKRRKIQQLETAEKASRAGKCLVEEAAAVDNDLKVQELQQQLESSKQAYDELSLWFDAYRKHSSDLLTKEKVLNVKLHHFIA